MTKITLSGRWDPFAGLRAMQRELERFTSRGFFGEAPSLDAGMYPPINVWSSTKEIIVECEMAGIKRDDIDLSITGDTLVIKGNKKPSTDEENVRYHRAERGAGEFTRTIVLPESVDADNISANMAEGVLTVRMPKSESAIPRKISVK